MNKNNLGKFQKGNIPHNKKNWHFESLTKELAYLIGAYLTDGSVCYRKMDVHKNGVLYDRYDFKLSSIDKEYTDYTRKCLEKTLQKPVKMHTEIKEGNRKLQYYVIVGNNDFGKWLMDISQNKKIIPEIIIKSDKQYQREFLIGALDGDGYCGENPLNGHLYYKMGLVGISGWFDGIKPFMQRFGLVIGKKKIDNREFRNVPLISYEINKESMLKNNLGFRIQRKQARLLRYAKIQNIGLLRDYTPPTLSLIR